MNVPIWKKYVSYLVELEIESTSSKYNPLLRISLKNGRFCLSTENAVYSHEDHYHNFRLSFKKLDWDFLEGKNVLVLGLGLGSIIQMLEQNFDKTFHYTAIELDETVSYLAEKYILHKLKSPLQVVNSDAELFLLNTSEKFDLICMDIFDDDVIPARFQEKNFLRLLSKSLNPSGILLYNTLAFTKEDRRLSKIFYQKSFVKIFPEGKLLKVKGNYMLVNDASSIN